MDLQNEKTAAEVCRYLGYDASRHQLTDSVKTLISESIRQIQAASQPRYVISGLLPLTEKPAGLTVGSGCILQGQDIRVHLQHCTSAVFLGATLGVQVDNLIRRAEVMDMAKAVALDAAANVAIEQLCSEAEETVRTQLKAQGKYLTMRFSPGYGDFPIVTQHELLSILDAPRRIGLSVTPTHIMTPRKSVTAVMGVSDIFVRGKLAGCGNCVMRNTCIYRKRGTTCNG